MKETQAIIDAWNAARAQNQPAILATVVGAEGSTYRRPGARMLLTPDGWAAGSISGGCLEGDIVRKAWWRTEAGAPVLVTYDSRSSDDDLAWGFGLGCNGVVRVLLETPWTFWTAAASRPAPVACWQPWWAKRRGWDNACCSRPTAPPPRPTSTTGRLRAG
jgi:hypothetical protein